MFSLIFIGAIIAMAVGLAAKFILDRLQSQYRIDNKELAIGSALVLLLIVPLTAYVGTRLAINSQVTYNENWGGYELKANWERIACTRDGPCIHEYDCDPYTVQVPYECGDYEGTGDDRRYVSRTCYRDETRYHDCPYTDEEWTFTVDTTVGEFTIAANNLPSDPEAHRWRFLKSVPGGIPSGIPAFWTECKQRLHRNEPGPVTARKEYENYLLASQNTILKRYSDSIERYKTAGLLPPINRQIHDFYHADRVYFVGVRPSGDWQAAINRFDAALGTQLQGDLHLVLVDANKITDPDNYQFALLAYWQSKEFEKDALSKNSIVVILGSVDGQTVKWARAGTGMPEGNEAMLVDIQNQLPSTRLEPEAVLGNPKATLVNGSVQVAHTQGALEKVIWGPNAFKRVHMGKPGESGNVGYAYLLREIEPTGWQRFWIIFCQVLLSCIVWGVCIAYGAPAYRSSPFGRRW